MTVRCLNCRFWSLDERDKDEFEIDARGKCHRHAPSPTKGQFEVELLNHLAMLTWHFAQGDYPESKFQVEEAVFDASFWPATWGDEWCGDHEPKEPA